MDEWSLMLNPAHIHIHTVSLLPFSRAKRLKELSQGDPRRTQPEQQYIKKGKKKKQLSHHFICSPTDPQQQREPGNVNCILHVRVYMTWKGKWTWEGLDWAMAGQPLLGKFINVLCVCGILQINSLGCKNRCNFCLTLDSITLDTRTYCATKLWTYLLSLCTAATVIFCFCHARVTHVKTLLETNLHKI